MILYILVPLQGRALTQPDQCEQMSISLVMISQSRPACWVFTELSDYVFCLQWKCQYISLLPHMQSCSKRAGPHLSQTAKKCSLNLAKEHEKKADEYWEHICRYICLAPVGSSMLGVNLARTTTQNLVLTSLTSVVYCHYILMDNFFLEITLKNWLVLYIFWNHLKWSRMICLLVVWLHSSGLAPCCAVASSTLSSLWVISVSQQLLRASLCTSVSPLS